MTNASQRLDELEKLLEAGTPGEWLALPGLPKGKDRWRVSDGEDFVCTLFAKHGDFENAPANAAFIAAIHNAAPGLIACATQLRRLHALIVEASETGFNYKTGDWATRLYESQGDTFAALNLLERRDG